MNADAGVGCAKVPAASIGSEIRGIALAAPPQPTHGFEEILHLWSREINARIIVYGPVAHKSAPAFGKSG
jgi:hypothetical protein